MSFFKRTFIATALSISMLVPLVSFAQVDNSALIAQLLEQIKALTAQLQTLQSQQQPTQWCYTFNKNIGIGTRGDEVQALHRALAMEGFETSAAGGERLNEFNEESASVIVGFQEKYKDEILTPVGLQRGSGYVGPSTRAKLNKLYGCSGGGGVTPPVQRGIVVISPQPNQVVSSPLVISGQVSGNGWTLFEGQVGTVKLLIKGSMVAQAILDTSSEYNMLPLNFGASLMFSTNGANEGVLVFENENPSGLPQNARKYTMPVRFSQPSTNQPVINSVTGPTSLRVGEQGTWTVNASDPNGGTLNYQALWGDITGQGSGIVGAPTPAPVSQSATFTHVYSGAGNYNPTFIVSNQYSTAKASISVNVVGGIASNHSPEILSGTAPTSVRVGERASFSWNGTDQDGDRISWSVGWGDGTGEAQACSSYPVNSGISTTNTATSMPVPPLPYPSSYSVSHIWNTVGVYTVNVNASDCRGGTDSDTVRVNVVGTIPSSLKVTSPNGGESLARGSSYPIQWTLPPNLLIYPAPLQTFDISLIPYIPCSGPYVACTSVMPYTIVKNYVNKPQDGKEGVYMWTVGNVQEANRVINDGQYYIQVCQAGTSICDKSDSYFKISTATTQPSITVLSPNGGESWQIGSMQTISWKLSDSTNSLPVNIYLLRNLSGCFNMTSGMGCLPVVDPQYTIAQNMSDNGSYQWNVGTFLSKLYAPDSILTGSNYILKICKGVNTKCDSSDATFSIVSANTN